MPITTPDVRNYYERNTRLFLKFGSSSQVQTIHRALWVEGVNNLPAALEVSNRLALAQALALNANRVLDVGCGVGASLFSLLSLSPSSAGVGVTLSGLQARLARQNAQKFPALQADFVEADFAHLPLAPGYFDLAYSIEAFIHAPDPRQYFAQAARVLRPGGRLAVLDDFLTPGASSPWLAVYRAGWHAPNLLVPSTAAEMAGKFGFALLQESDQTPHLRLRAMPEPFARLLLFLFRPLWRVHPLVPSMLGSMALQQALHAGCLTYRWLVWEKTA